MYGLWKLKFFGFVPRKLTLVLKHWAVCSSHQSCIRKQEHSFWLNDLQKYGFRENIPICATASRCALLFSPFYHPPKQKWSILCSRQAVHTAPFLLCQMRLHEELVSSLGRSRTAFSKYSAALPQFNWFDCCLGKAWSFLTWVNLNKLPVVLFLPTYYFTSTAVKSSCCDWGYLFSQFLQVPRLLLTIMIFSWKLLLESSDFFQGVSLVCRRLISIERLLCCFSYFNNCMMVFNCNIYFPTDDSVVFAAGSCSTCASCACRSPVSHWMSCL